MRRPGGPSSARSRFRKISTAPRSRVRRWRRSWTEQRRRAPMRSAPARAAEDSTQPIPLKGGRKWFGRVLRRRDQVVPDKSVEVVSASDGLDAFAEEGAPAAGPIAVKPAVPAAAPTRPRGRGIDLQLAALLLLLGAAVAVGVYYGGGAPSW